MTICTLPVTYAKDKSEVNNKKNTGGMYLMYCKVSFLFADSNSLNS